MSLTDQINKRVSYHALSEVLEGRVARDYQIRDALAAISRESAILSHDTGTGKTTIAALIMRLLKNENRHRKFLFIGRARQKHITPREIEEVTGMVVRSYSTTYRDIERLAEGDFYNADIVFLSHETLNEFEMMEALFKHIHLFDCVIADEAHLLGNFREASSAWMFNSICRRVKYRFALTATPMTSQIRQISDLFYALDWETFPDPNVLRNKIMGGQVNVQRDFSDFYYKFDRNDLGVGNNYLPEFLVVEPTEEQEGTSGREMMEKTRGEGAIPQQKATLERVQKEVDSGKQGIVYVYQHRFREALLKYKEQRPDLDFKYGCIHGRTGTREYNRVIEQFNRKEIDVIFTSISTHMNLDCEFIMFYEWDINLRQVVGRAERSLVPKEIRCIFLFTDKTGEYLRFINNVWVRAVTVEDTLKKDYGFIILLGETILKAGLVDSMEVNWENV